ncbi:MAG: cobalamin-dependent protein, partial [Phycisphaerales bacterium]|nr:cobalamin-dependent protein [Phycisphaerales bacterium]
MGDALQAGFVAELLHAEAARVGHDAARRLLADNGVSSRWGGDALTTWARALESRVHELAASVAAQRPRDLASRASWARAAFEARGIDPRDLVASLEALRDAALAAVPEDDASLVSGVIDAAIDAARGPAPEVPAELSPDAPNGRLAGEYLLALLEGERLRALALIRDAVAGGRASVPDVYQHVFIPVLRDLGRMWHLGEVNVAEEHFATATTLISMSQIAPLAPRAPSNGRSVLAATVAGNTHEVGVRMVADRLEWEGWRVVYLGPNVPAEDLAQAAVDFGVDV